jgi:hypothetical protein
MIETTDKLALQQATAQIKAYLGRTLEVLDSGKVQEARGMLVKLYVGLDDYSTKEGKT